jgi:carboxyl-terminal processing protease
VGIDQHQSIQWRIRLLASGVLALGLLLGGCSNTGEVVEEDSTAQTHETTRTLSSEDALADFDRMWEIINTTHFDPEFNGVDWEAVRDELRPQAAQARNRREIRRIMSDALGRFGQSHFAIIGGAVDDAPAAQETEQSQAHPGESTVGVHEEDASTGSAVFADDSSTDGTGDGDTGIDIRILDGQAVVTSIREQSPAQLVGVQTGWVLTKVRSDLVADGLERLAQSVEGVEFDIYGRRFILDNHLQGPPGTSIDLTFLDGDDQEVELDIARAPMPGEFVKFGNLPPLSTHLDYSRFTTVGESGQRGEIGVISFNIWMMPIAAKFERAMYELRDVDGLIIDLRGNPGGIGGLSSSIGRFLLSEKGSLGTMTMRGAELKFNIEPVIVTTWGEPIDPFAGPIAILTDSGTASTSEVFAGGLQSLGRVEVFGTRSAGMALPAGMDKLPSGDVLLHAIANFVTSTGYQLEHGGVVPDTEVKMTREDLLNGNDAPKQAAIEWIERQTAE